jgi:protein tyrosine phosphatase
MEQVLAKCFWSLEESNAEPDDDPSVPDALDRFRGFSAQPEQSRYVNRSGIGNEYINANWVDKDHRYLATQAPVPRSMGDFWYMVMQARVRAIFMLTDWEERGKCKANHYFPEESTLTMTFSLSKSQEPLRVKCLAVNSLLPDAKQHIGRLLERNIEIEFLGRVIRVHHYHYRDWPDGRIPDNLENVRRLLRLEHSKGQPGSPVLVHCSAGVGRAGTFLLARIALDREIYTTGEFCKLLEELRQHGRRMLVQTATQFLFAWRLVQSIRAHTALINAPLPSAAIVGLKCEMCQIHPACMQVQHKACSTPVAYCSMRCCDHHVQRTRGSLCGK